MRKIFTILSSAIVISATAQTNSIPNSSLESWVTQMGSFEDPSNWPSSNYLAFFGMASGNSVFKTTPGHAGTYAARLSSVPLTSNPLPGMLPDTVALIVSGSIVVAPTPALKGIPFTSKPAKLECYAKYDPNGTDTAFIAVALTKWNSTLMQQDTIAAGFTTIDSQVSSFTKYEVTLTYNSTTITPDTAMILVLSSGFNQPKINSELIVDAFAFTGGNVGYQEVAMSSPVVKHYPNPANETLTIESGITGQYRLRVFDITGRETLNKQLSSPSASLDVKNFPAGIYFYKLTGANNEQIHTGKFHVAR